jgi:hypothetical protein
MMPHRCCGFDNAMGLFMLEVWMLKGLERVESSFRSAAEECFLGRPLLDAKMSRMKFNKSIIVTCQAIYRDKTFIGARNM